MEGFEYYTYLYLDPRKKIPYTIDLGSKVIKLDYEPFYVGKGKNSRIYDHLRMIKNNPLKNRIITRILRDIDIQDYKDNYILKVIENASESDALYYEYEISKQIGTRVSLSEEIKKGPLCNLTIPGKKNPVLKGELNPMFGVNIYDNKTVEEREEIRKKVSRSSKERWDSLSENEIQELREKIKSGNHFRNKSKSEIENWKLQNLVGKSNPNWKGSSICESCGKVGKARSSKNCMDCHLSKDRTKENSPYYIFLSSLDEADRQEWISKNRSKESNPFLNKLKSFSKEGKEIYLNENFRGDNSGFYKLKRKIGEEEFQKWMEKYRMGSSNPNFGNGEKISGEKNPRSKRIIIHFPDGRKYVTIGNFKRFAREVLSKFKPQPHKKYQSKCYETGEEIDGWFFKIVDNEFNLDNYIHYK